MTRFKTIALCTFALVMQYSPLLIALLIFLSLPMLMKKTFDYVPKLSLHAVNPHQQSDMRHWHY